MTVTFNNDSIFSAITQEDKVKVKEIAAQYNNMNVKIKPICSWHDNPHLGKSVLIDMIPDIPGIIGQEIMALDIAFTRRLFHIEVGSPCIIDSKVALLGWEFGKEYDVVLQLLE